MPASDAARSGRRATIELTYIDRPARQQPIRGQMTPRSGPGHPVVSWCLPIVADQAGHVKAPGGGRLLRVGPVSLELRSARHVSPSCEEACDGDGPIQISPVCFFPTASRKNAAASFP